MTVRYAGVGNSSWAGIKKLISISGLKEAVVNFIYDARHRVVSYSKSSFSIRRYRGSIGRFCMNIMISPGGSKYLWVA
jgi:hypothetical protein